MRTKRLTLWALSALVLCTGGWLFIRSGSLNRSLPKPLMALLQTQTPIDFFGIVIDQDGNPVSEATVEGSGLNALTKGSSQAIKSDRSGRFTIQTKGMSLHVAVSKDGYYSMGGETGDKASSRGFYFVENLGPSICKPDPSNPEVFHLHKAGVPVKLLQINRNPNIPRNGSMVKVVLDGNPAHSLDLRCWTHEDEKTPDGRYDWKCEITVPDGGLQDSLNDFDFLAPDAGYTQIAVIEMPLTVERLRWKSDFSKRYWIKFNDGIYARVRVRMISRGDHFAVIEGFLNPTAGSQNLEPERRHR